MFKKKKSKSTTLIFIIMGIIWVISMGNPESEPFGWMLFGTCFFIPSIVSIYLRIDFDVSKKHMTEGELVTLEKVYDDNSFSYRPIYRYILGIFFIVKGLGRLN